MSSDGESAPDKRLLEIAIPVGLLLGAGVLHLLLVEGHLASARGSGLFFLFMGIAQIAWAITYMTRPTARLALLGAAGVALMPTVLYVFTRVLRAPWSTHPEGLDTIGLATQLLQVGAAVLLLWPERNNQWIGRAGAVGVGLLLGAGAYGGALAVEDIDIFSEGELPHSHAAAHAHGGHDDHGGHGGEPLVGTRGLSVVGNISYYGPETAQAILDECRDLGEANEDCWLYFLKGLLSRDGSIRAFDLLDELTTLEPAVKANSHAMAHVLGHHAYNAYGLDITLTIGECSYKVFQGCLHGALQAFFADLAARGLELDRVAMNSLCAASTSSFESYSCNHGVGHGIMMHSNYDLPGSLDQCTLMDTRFTERSCIGGVYMENVVAYLDSLKPGWEPHDHGAGPPEFWIDEDDPAYPCPVVKKEFRDACWVMQTSIVLRFNGGDFRDASRTCDEAGDHAIACYQGLGRDAPPYANRDPYKMSQMCSYGTEEQRYACVQAFAAGVVLQASDPAVGMSMCGNVWEAHQEACYHEIGQQARSMLGKADAVVFCETAPDAFVATCKDGTG